jgi:hypothetical protein
LVINILANNNVRIIWEIFWEGLAWFGLRAHGLPWIEVYHLVYHAIYRLSYLIAIGKCGV